MEPAQALEILKQMAEQAALPKQAHVNAQIAYETLKKLIEGTKS